MTPQEIVQAQIDHVETETIPYTLAFEPEVEARLDAYYGGAAWRDRLTPFIVYTPKLANYEDEILDAAHYRDSFGAIWRTDELPPVVVEPALANPSFEGYTFPTVGSILDRDAKAEARQIAAETPDSFTVVAGVLCLWRCWYLRGFANTMVDCVAEQDFYTELLERMTRLTLAFVEQCADIPADAIMMGDDWGGQRGVLIGPERWRKFYKSRYARIFQAIHDQGKIAVMHCCGSPADIMGDIIEIGLDVLESVQPEAAGMNPYALKNSWGDKIAFWVGLGSQSMIPFGKPEEIRREIRHLRSEMGRDGGYILAPAKALRQETPTENAVAVVEGFLE